MGKKHIQGGKEMNTGVGKETHTGREGSTYTVGRKCIHAPACIIIVEFYNLFEFI